MKRKGEEEFFKILDSYRDKNKKYDCIFGISGGRDSSYALCYLVKVCNLRVLAYTADNGFVSEQAKLNMKNMTDILNVKHIIEKHDLVKKCIKQNILAFIHNRSPALIGWLCNGCKLAVDRGLLYTAKRYKIPLLISGGSSGVEDTEFKRKLLTFNPNSRMETFSLMFGALFEIINPRYFLHPTCLIINVKEFIYHFLPFKIIQKIVYPSLREISLFDYIEWNEKEIISTIVNELEWEKSPYIESTWRMDCKINWLKNYLYKETLVFTEKDDALSCMIRENMITREEALERLKKENVIPQKLIMELVDELGLKFGDIIDALNNWRESGNAKKQNGN